MGTSRETGGTRPAGGASTEAQTRTARPALPRPGTPPRRVAMPRTNAQGNYSVSAQEFERATGRRVGRRRGNR